MTQCAPVESVKRLLLREVALGWGVNGCEADCDTNAQQLCLKEKGHNKKLLGEGCDLMDQVLKLRRRQYVETPISYKKN